MTLTPNARAYVAWGFVSIVWGTTYLSNAIGIQSIPPFLYAGIRFLLAGTLLLAFQRLRRNADPSFSFARQLFDPASLAGIAILGGGVGLAIWSQQWLPSGIAAVLVAATPVWMVLLDRLMPGGDRITLPSVLGMAFALAGVFLIARDQHDLSAGAEHAWAIGVLLLGGLGWSAGSIYTRHRRAPGGVLTTAAFQMLWAGAVLLLASLLTGERLTGPVAWPSVAALLYVVFVGSILAYGAYLYALRHLSTAFVSSYVFVNPVVALWLGALVLDERLSEHALLASVAILAGLALMRLPEGWLKRAAQRHRRRRLDRARRRRTTGENARSRPARSPEPTSSRV